MAQSQKSGGNGGVGGVVEEEIGSFVLEEDNQKDICMVAKTRHGHPITIPDTTSGIPGEYVLIRREPGSNDPVDGGSE